MLYNIITNWCLQEVPIALICLNDRYIFICGLQYNTAHPRH